MKSWYSKNNLSRSFKPLTILAKRSILDIWQGSEYVFNTEYTWVLNMPGLCKVLNMPECLKIPKYAWLSLSMPEHVWICHNMPKLPEWIFFTFPFCNNLSARTSGYLPQRLNDTRNYSLEEHEAAFLKRQNLFFSTVTGSIWFTFWLNIFWSKISNLLLPFEANGAGGAFIISFT